MCTVFLFYAGVIKETFKHIKPSSLNIGENRRKSFKLLVFLKNFTDKPYTFPLIGEHLRTLNVFRLTQLFYTKIPLTNKPA